MRRVWVKFICESCRLPAWSKKIGAKRCCKGRNGQRAALKQVRWTDPAQPWQRPLPRPSIVPLEQRISPEATNERRERVEQLTTQEDKTVKRVGYCEICNREMVYYSTLPVLTCSPECESQLFIKRTSDDR